MKAWNHCSWQFEQNSILNNKNIASNQNGNGT